MTAFKSTLCLTLVSVLFGCQHAPLPTASMVPTQTTAQAVSQIPTSDLLPGEIAMIKTAVAKQYPQITVTAVEGRHTRAGYDFSVTGLTASGSVTLSGNYYAPNDKLTLGKPAATKKQPSLTVSPADQQAFLDAAQKKFSSVKSMTSLKPSVGQSDVLDFVMEVVSARHLRPGLVVTTSEITGTYAVTTKTLTVTATKILNQEIH